MARGRIKIPIARLIIQYVIDHCGISAEAKMLLRHALELMWREAPDHRAPSKHIKITPEMREHVLELRRTTDLTQFEIAQRTGVENQGRVSEIKDGL